LKRENCMSDKTKTHWPVATTLAASCARTRTYTFTKHQLTKASRKHSMLDCIALHCIALHCIALHCIALHCIALHCPWRISHTVPGVDISRSVVCTALCLDKRAVCKWFPNNSSLVCVCVCVCICVWVCVCVCVLENVSTGLR